MTGLFVWLSSAMGLGRWHKLDSSVIGASGIGIGWSGASTSAVGTGMALEVGGCIVGERGGGWAG